jgi:hypothetical protein
LYCDDGEQEQEQQQQEQEQEQQEDDETIELGDTLTNDKQQTSGGTCNVQEQNERKCM